MKLKDCILSVLLAMLVGLTACGEKETPAVTTTELAGITSRLTSVRSSASAASCQRAGSKSSQGSFSGYQAPTQRSSGK